MEDAAEGIVLATERYEDAEPVNLGSGEEISIKALADMVAQTVGFRGKSYGIRANPTASLDAPSTRAGRGRALDSPPAAISPAA